MLVGAGVLTAFDERTPNSTFGSGLGGLLQASSYIGGVSGGSWLVISNLVNDLTPIHLMQDDNRYWHLDRQLLEGVPSFDPREFLDKDREQPSAANSTDSKPGILDNIIKLFQFGKSQANEDEEGALPKNKKSGGGLFSVFKPLWSQPSNESSTIKDKISMKDVFRFYTDLQIEVRPKRIAGFHISFTDYWGRALVRKIFGINARSPGVTLTDCTKLDSFKKFQQPFPIIGTIEANASRFNSSKSSRLFEFTPYEFGSWDSYLAAFVPIKYLGSTLYAGYSKKPIGNSSMAICTTGFDNVGFITATSSSLFNHIFAHVYSMLFRSQSTLTAAISSILKSFGLSADYHDSNLPHLHPDYAVISPNPFHGYNSKNVNSSDTTNKEHMYLVDGGDDGQNILFQSFLVRAREVDIILAYDMTADVNNYPNGTTLHNSQLRYHNRYSTMSLPSFLMVQPPNNIASNSSRLSPTVVRKSVFPRAPDRDKIVSLRLNKEPIFLGCDLISDYPILESDAKFYGSPKKSNRTLYQKDVDTYLPPLIVYTANENYGYSANTSTFQLSYNKSEVAGLLHNGYNMATNKNSSDFSVCLRCAILKRHFDRIRLGIAGQSAQNHTLKIPQTCIKCYQKYCR